MTVLPDSPSPVDHPMTREMTRSVTALVAEGKLQDDPAQEQAITAFNTLLHQLNTLPLSNKKSSLGWLFGKSPRQVNPSARGIYIWGSVGRGKSMLMDLFFELAPTNPPHTDSRKSQKKRVHFHSFMQDVHGRIHQWRQLQKTSKERSADPIPPLADALASEAKLLCFDEFAVTDVADAMILARLFTGLFERGVTVVATSNVMPDLLYKDGLNRSFFLPFIELAKTKMQVLELSSPTDYRMEKLINSDVYMVGNDSPARFDALWGHMTNGVLIAPATIEVVGRRTEFEFTSGGLVRTSFHELCERPLGAGDYLALADRFHTLFLERIPTLRHSDRNAVKRFIALVDTLYDKGRILIVQADAQPDELYKVEHGTEAFEFKRTISRLREMQSDDWLARKDDR